MSWSNRCVTSRRASSQPVTLDFVILVREDQAASQFPDPQFQRVTFVACSVLVLRNRPLFAYGFNARLQKLCLGNRAQSGLGDGSSANCQVVQRRQPVMKRGQQSQVLSGTAAARHRCCQMP